MSNLSEAMKGNDNGLKLKDRDVRQRAYDKYCEWLSKGKTKKSFSFKEKQPDGSILMAHWQTIESYIKSDPAEFDPLKREIAYAEGCAKWESVVDDTAEGARKDTSVPTLNMIMRNKYKWDTVEHEKDADGARADLTRFAQQRSKERDEWPSGQPKDHSDSQEVQKPDC